MSENAEDMLKSIEKRLERLEKAIPPEMTCPYCGRLLTIHEDYENVVYDGTSHAQCYHCLKAVKLDESKQLHRKWKWPKWPSPNKRTRKNAIRL